MFEYVYIRNCAVLYGVVCLAYLDNGKYKDIYISCTLYGVYKDYLDEPWRAQRHPYMSHYPANMTTRGWSGGAVWVE